MYAPSMGRNHGQGGDGPNHANWYRPAQQQQQQADVSQSFMRNGHPFVETRGVQGNGSKRQGEVHQGSGGSSQDKAARQAVYQRKAADLDAEAIAFDEVDLELTGWVNEEQVRELLQRYILNQPVSVEGVGFVMTSARRGAAAAYCSDIGGEAAAHTMEMVPRDVVLNAVHKYRYYLARASDFDAMYYQFDRDVTGRVNRKNIKAILDADKQTQGARFGNISRMHATIYNKDTFESHLDFVLSESIVNSDGSIDRAEMLPALATWEMLGEEKMSKAPEACCSLM